ncbi:MAG: hypothetical protein AAGE59_09885 [Cyanobacteria bacterium P01_F01_bin.86]
MTSTKHSLLLVSGAAVVLLTAVPTSAKEELSRPAIMADAMGMAESEISAEHVETSGLAITTHRTTASDFEIMATDNELSGEATVTEQIIRFVAE